MGIFDIQNFIKDVSIANTIEELINYLNKFPKKYFVRAYEGEECGLVIEDDSGDEVGFFRC